MNPCLLWDIVMVVYRLVLIDSMELKESHMSKKNGRPVLTRVVQDEAVFQPPDGDKKGV